ncbi:MAG: multiheme c-type cytochrome [Bryobacteraceae bacterium]
MLLIALLFAIAAHAQYAGAKACAGCHPDQFARQSASSHARSLSKVADHPLKAKFAPLIAGRKPDPEWAFGGGLQAVTFVSRIGEDSYLEHHLSYYASTGKLAVTPGHSGKPEPGVRYETFSGGAEILRCFRCHSTGVPKLGADWRVEPTEPGVRCESCHGPGEAHAKSAGKEPVVAPGKYSAAELNQMCGSCHRKPAAAGEDTDYSNPWNIRHQPVYLSQSKCFLKSNGRMSCLTCHDAHGGPARSQCAVCHIAPKHPAAVRVASNTCEGCHMPLVRPQPELRFANHWIGVYRAGSYTVPIVRP